MNAKSGPEEAVAGTRGVSQLFQEALNALDVDQRAKTAGVSDQPPSHSTAPDAHEREFITYFTNKLRAQRDKSERALSQFALDRAASSSHIDIAQTRAELASLFNSIEPELARLKQLRKQDLELKKDEEARALRHLRHFQIEHHLQNRDADPAPSYVWHFALVASFAVLEWISLSVFYAEGSDFGLLGGVIMAMALSIINIGLAVFAGAILRYLNHKSVTRKLLAFLGVSVLSGLFLLATGFAAHYRNAAREIAPSHAQAPQPMVGQPNQSPSFLGGRAVAGDDDQFRASMLAWDQFVDHGFMFRDVLSWLLVIFAGMFGVVAAWKGYGVGDRYPGYGPTFYKFRECRAAYDAARTQYTEEVDGIFIAAGNKQQNLLREVRKHIDYYQELARQSDVWTRSYGQFAQEVEQTCNDIVVRYRQKNREVATSPAPEYFRHAVRVEPALMFAPEPLSPAEKIRLQEYSDAIREFTEVVQEYDARRQDMRTRYLEALHKFFSDIELAIDDKLAREGAAFRS